MFAVQTITTNWTKASRGGQFATLRNRVPKRLPLLIPSDRSNLIWHVVKFSEANRFTEPYSEEVKTFATNERFGCSNVEIAFEEDIAVLTYQYRKGAPVRRFYTKGGDYFRPEHAIEIRCGQWASIEYNNRSAGEDEGNWWYEHVVVNVAVAETVTSKIFMVSEPIEHYRQIARLW